MRSEEAAAPPADADGLGAVILETKPKALPADIFLALALLFLIGAGLAPFTADFRTGVVLGPSFAAGGILFALFGIVYVLANGAKVAYLHEHGLRVRGRGGWRVVRYPDVTEMTFKATRVFVNGVYTGTNQEMGLRTDAGEKPAVFRHTYKEKTGLATGYGEGTPLNGLADVLTGLIARQMADRLQRGEAVPWGRALSITPRGVEVVNRGGGRLEVEWDRIGRVDVQQGVFRLWVAGDPKPRAQMMVAEPNFFPGYALVVRRLQGQPLAAPTAVTASLPAPKTAPPAAVALSPSSPLPEGADAVRLEYTPTIEDHLALARRFYRATPEGRRVWAGRVWPLPLLVIGVGLLIGLINIFNKDIPEIDGVAAVILIIGMLLRPLVGWLAPLLDRARLSRELRAARELAWQGRGPDPFAVREALLWPQGYVLRTPSGEGRHGWGEVSRVECFEGYVFVFLAPDRVRRERIELILPPRTFRDRRQSRELAEQIEAWHAAVVDDGRRPS
jgi:hypothetical protein